MKNNKILIILATSLIVFMFFTILVSAETIVIDPNENPFNNSTNVTNSTNSTLDPNSSYLANVTDETLRKLIDALVEGMELNQEEREYLKSILESSSEERRQFQEALAKLDYAYKNAIEDRNSAINDKNEYITSTKVRMETLETEVESIRLENTKLKAWVFFYIILGLVFGILVLEVAHYLSKNQKSYFVIRWIRDKIPIKF